MKDGKNTRENILGRHNFIALCVLTTHNDRRHDVQESLISHGMLKRFADA